MKQQDKLRLFKLSEMDTADSIKEFEKSGCVQISDFLPVEKVSQLASAIEDMSEACEDSSGSITVGDKRIMFPLPVSGAFNDPDLFASPSLWSFFEATLGKGFVLNCYTCVISYPGAKTQHLHRDYEGLFGNPIDHLAPSFAINLFVPLVPLNKENGTTRLWPGSHRNVDSSETVGVDPVVNPGSALLMDYRLLHQGMPNLSANPRPMLCIAYTRDWFIDAKHFEKIKPLNLHPDDFAKLPLEHRALFKRVSPAN